MEASQQTCYRHPGRETNVSCSNCGNPICTDCMTPSPVGMRCPDCSSERQKVYTRADITPGPVAAAWRDAPVTTALIAINLAVFLLQIATGAQLGLMTSSVQGWATEQGVFFGPLIADGEYWRVITPGFLHFGLLHIALNMYLLYVLGRMLEPELGAVQMLAIYMTSLIAGSLGAMILEPETPSAGASGAVFGLMGMALVVAWSRQNREALQQIGILVAINLFITFGNSSISKGGHLGGMLGGVICALILFKVGERHGLLGVHGKRRWIGTTMVVSLGLILYAACILLARNEYPQFVG
ncbi:MAG: rhomboid family intramembrane serine protease [Thermoleophilaceae bacterium]|nr:rhomboid family intramembrane serine protease [Thermoleophilaceae bacterium]